MIAAEGGYVNDPRDPGGETMYGITIATARENGYFGPMSKMPEAVAREIYRKRYVSAPGFDRVLSRSNAIGAELIDTGVNMGPAVASRFLQRALNVLNDGRFADVIVDGVIGPVSLRALDAYLAWRGKDGEIQLVKLLNALQAARYVEIAEGRPASERFVYGWIKNRVIV
ncbi:glycosyl hydrolase 108 family protein [Sphingomonas sp.]|uniref:glycoside hydrolase family 108 protein n=1 Tax=Sphingomonas sp. TaxID=28214 RepID=UPI00338EED1B